MRRRRPQSYADLVIASAPVAYWRLGERSGTAARDSMGTSHGTLTGTATRGTQGLLAGDGDASVQFTASAGAYISGSAAGLPVGVNAPFSIEVLTQFNNLATRQFVLGFSESTAIRALIRYNSHVYFWGNGNDLDSSADYGSGSAHIVATYDGTTLRLYKDAVQIASGAKAFGAGDTTFAFAKQAFGGAGFMVETQARLDEGAIYRRALTVAEITEHAAAGR